MSCCWWHYIQEFWILLAFWVHGWIKNIGITISQLSVIGEFIRQIDQFLAMHKTILLLILSEDDVFGDNGFVVSRRWDRRVLAVVVVLWPDGSFVRTFQVSDRLCDHPASGCARLADINVFFLYLVQLIGGIVGYQVGHEALFLFYIRLALLVLLLGLAFLIRNALIRWLISRHFQISFPGRIMRLILRRLLKRPACLAIDHLLWCSVELVHLRSRNHIWIDIVVF